MNLDHSFSKHLKGYCCFIGMLLSANSSFAQIVTLSLDLNHFVLFQGQSFIATISVSGLGVDAPPSLGTFDFNINYNPSALSPSKVSFGDPSLGDQLNLTGLGSVTSSSNIAGSLNLFEISFDSVSALNAGQSGEFDLAQITFNTQTSGLVNLNYSDIVLGDALGDPLEVNAVGSSLLVLPPQQLSVVPEPSTYGLSAVCALIVPTILFSKRIERRKAQVRGALALAGRSSL